MLWIVNGGHFGVGVAKSPVGRAAGALSPNSAIHLSPLSTSSNHSPPGLLKASPTSPLRTTDSDNEEMMDSPNNTSSSPGIPMKSPSSSTDVIVPNNKVRKHTFHFNC